MVGIRTHVKYFIDIIIYDNNLASYCNHDSGISV